MARSRKTKRKRQQSGLSRQNIHAAGIYDSVVVLGNHHLGYSLQAFSPPPFHQMQCRKSQQQESHMKESRVEISREEERAERQRDAEQDELETESREVRQKVQL